jgi:Uma2 family endonuclease
VVPQELAYGVLRVSEAPLARHQSAVADFFRALDTHVRERKLGKVWLSPIDVVLDEARAVVVQPDLLFISNENASIVSDRIRGGPDLVIEVLSPHPRIGRLEERVAWFAEYGVRECWLLRQDERVVDVLTLSQGRVIADTRFTRQAPIVSNVLPDFKKSLNEILEG